MSGRRYRGADIECHASGWLSAHVLSPKSGPWGPYYVTVKADTVDGIRDAIDSVLAGEL